MSSKYSIRAAAAFLVLGTAILGWSFSEMTRAEDAPKKVPGKKSIVMQTFMKVKLTQAQGILEGLTVEDFDKIETNASALYLLTKAENWKASRDPQFISHSDEFARVAEKLAKYAREKNLDGAALTYVQLTMNCIECHKFVRDKSIQFRDAATDKDAEN
jgi:hypothetical protein